MSIAPWINEPDVDVEALIDAEDRPAVPGEESVKNPWSIQSPGEAEWAMGRLALTESELAAIEAQRAEWQLQLDKWHDAVMRRPMKRRALFVGWLTDYARRQREETGTATLALPSGRVTSRRNPAKLVVSDSEVVLAWAWQNARSVVKETVRLDELRKVVSALEGRPVSIDGEVVPGLDVEPGFTSYSVKVAK